MRFSKRGSFAGGACAVAFMACGPGIAHPTESATSPAKVVWSRPPPPVDDEPVDPEPGPELPGEWERVERLLIGWADGASTLTPFWRTLLEVASAQTRVTVVVPSARDSNAVARELARTGIDHGDIEIETAPLDTMWIRDYGPLVVRWPSGDRQIVDLPYTEQRPLDDQLPQLLGDRWHLPVSHLTLDMEGGHLQADGAGRCIVTEDVLARNAALPRSEVAARLRESVGCRQLVSVDSLLAETTGHLDMLAYVTGPGRVLVGEYLGDDDPDNAILLDGVARDLEHAGFAVIRIPMPSSSGGEIFRSYTNALALNDVVLVPVFEEDTRYESRALEIFEREMKGRTVVPIASDEIIPQEGAIHCVTMTIGG